MQMRAASLELPLVGQLPMASELAAAVLPPVKSTCLMVQLPVAVTHKPSVVRRLALLQAAAAGHAPVFTELAGAAQFPAVLVERRVAAVELLAAAQQLAASVSTSMPWVPARASLVSPLPLHGSAMLTVQQMSQGSQGASCPP